MIGKCSIYYFKFCSENLSTYLITSAKNIGLHKLWSFTAWVTIGVYPSLWTSNSTHFIPFYKSYVYLSTWQSLVNWFPER